MAIGNSNNKLATRIQLKSDTEANWIANPIVPLIGEMIIYTPDDNHPYSRLKIGDGQTNVVNLPFVDAGSLNGNEEIICKYDTFNNFPSRGSSQCLYLDTSTSQMYHYDAMLGYKSIATVSLNATSTTIKEVVYWGPGRAATASIEDNKLKLQNGIAPQLLTQNTTVLTSVQVGGNN